METSVKERLILYLKHLKIGQKKFAQSVGLSDGYVNAIRNSIQPDTLHKISMQYPSLNTGWLITGEGNMLKTACEQYGTESNAAKKEHVIRYYDIQASAGGIGMYSDNKESYSNLIVPGFDDCDIALNVWGDSMEPILKSGEIVTMREWKEPFIDWGKIYLVVTNSGYRMIKYLKKSENNDEVICESANPDHDPFPIKKSDIAKLFQIKGCISRYSI